MLTLVDKDHRLTIDAMKMGLASTDNTVVVHFGEVLVGLIMSKVHNKKYYSSIVIQDIILYYTIVPKNVVFFVHEKGLPLLEVMKYAILCIIDDSQNFFN